MESMTGKTSAYAALKISECLQEEVESGGGVSLRSWVFGSGLQSARECAALQPSEIIGDMIDLTQHLRLLNIWGRLDLKGKEVLSCIPSAQSHLLPLLGRMRHDFKSVYLEL